MNRAARQDLVGAVLSSVFEDANHNLLVHVLSKEY